MIMKMVRIRLQLVTTLIYVSKNAPSENILLLLLWRPFVLLIDWIYKHRKLRIKIAWYWTRSKRLRECIVLLCQHWSVFTIYTLSEIASIYKYILIIQNHLSAFIKYKIADYFAFILTKYILSLNKT